MHEPALAMVSALALLLIGCVIPPSLEVAEDAGINSPPAIVTITSDRQVLPEPGPVRFDQQTMDTLSISLIDTDVLDTLYVGIFVDYNLPDRLAARSRCFAPPTGDATRTATCRLNSLCVDADIGSTRNMQVVVFDRPPDDTGAANPPFQAMSDGGWSTSRFYFLNCQPPQL